MFDIDGTLVRSEPDVGLYEEAMKEWLSIDSINTCWASYREVTDPGIAAELFEAVKGEKASPGDIGYVENLYYNKLEQTILDGPNACIPMEGVLSFFHEIQKLPDTTMAVATGGWEKTARLKLRHAGIPCSRMPMATADDADSREKIMQIAYDRAMQTANVSEFQKVFYFGDGEWDVVAALNMGYNFIGIADSNRKNSLIEKGAKIIYRDFKDYNDLIDLVYKT